MAGEYASSIAASRSALVGPSMGVDSAAAREAKVGVVFLEAMVGMMRYFLGVTMGAGRW